MSRFFSLTRLWAMLTKELPAALVAPTQDRFTRAMVSAPELTGYYRFIAPDSTAGEADATDPSVASGAISTLSTVANAALQREAGQKASTSQGVEIIVHKRYNHEGITQYNIVPGLLGVILQLTMVMMTAMALTRETERWIKAFSYYAESA